jgi:hypothetical protein
LNDGGADGEGAKKMKWGPNKRDRKKKKEKGEKELLMESVTYWSALVLV